MRLLSLFNIDLDEVTVTTIPSSFRMRARVNLRALARRWWIVTLLGALVPSPFVLLLALVWDGEMLGMTRGTVGGYITLGGVVLAWVFSVLTVLIRSLEPSVLELTLPRAMTFRRNRIFVTQRTGDRHEVDWTWIKSAEESARGIDLILSESPRTLITLERAVVPEDALAKLRAWLVEHEKLPAARRTASTADERRR